MTQDPDLTALLPLRPVEYHVLWSLTGGPRHGYGIMQDAEARSGAGVIPDVATLYRALKRTVKAGLIEPGAPSPEGRRRTDYVLTALGGRVARAESQRMASLVRNATRIGLLEG